jgi:transmembrane sensor
MEKEAIKILFQDYIAGKLSTEDFLKVEVILKEGQHTDIWEEVINETSIDKTQIKLDDISKYSLLTRILSTTESSKTTIKRFRSVLKYAAIILMTVGLTWSAYIVGNQEESTPTEVAMIEKSNIEGRKTTFNLPDGTIVKLNSSSKLQFPKYFDKDKREVTLEGEAFFEVTKNKEKPFIIKSGSITTTVLGTSFNVNAYPSSDQIQVAVVTGKVKVETDVQGINKETVFLEPNKKAVYKRANGLLTTTSFLIEEDIAWKDGVIIFKNAEALDVIQKLEEWYGVEITIENKSPKKWNLSAKFENENLEHVLKVIGHQIGFKFKIKEKKVTIKY